MTGDGPFDDDPFLLDVEEFEQPEPPDGVNVRVLAPTVGAITDVTALVGPDLEPLRCHIYIRDGVIAAIVPAVPGAAPLAAAPPPERDQMKTSKAVTVDGAGMFAIPGLVDAHARMRPFAPAPAPAPGLPVSGPAAAAAPAPGLPATGPAAAAVPLVPGLLASGPAAAAVPLVPGLPASAAAAAAAARMGPEEYELAALQAGLQRLKCGVTTVVDHAYPFHAPDLDMACVGGYESSGVRWACARGIMTRPRSPLCETFEQAADNIRALLADTPATPERLFVAPVSIACAAPADFARAAALAEELGAGTYACVAETPADRAAWLRETKAEPVVALDRAGFLTDRTVLARGVFFDGDEIEVLARRRSHVVHCPAAGPRAPAGWPDLPGLLAAGVNVALGSDVVPDLFSAMRAELHAQSLRPGGSAAPSSLRVLQMATARGAAAAFPGSTVPADPADFDFTAQSPRIPIGELSTGHAADIVLFPAAPLLETLLDDPVQAVVHHARGPMVRDVLVDGQLVVSDGVSTLVDEHELVLEAERVRNSWIDRLD